MKQKRALSVLLCLVMALTLIPLGTLSALAVEHYDVWVGSVEATSANKDAIGGNSRIKYDPTTTTLTITTYGNDYIKTTYKEASIYYGGSDTLTIRGRVDNTGATGVARAISAPYGSVILTNTGDTGRLNLSSDGPVIRVRYDITIRNVNAYLYAGDNAAIWSEFGSVTIDKLVSKGYVSARISGSGRIRLEEVDVDGDMGLKTSGAGSITVNGACHDVSATTTGSGSISGNLSYTHIHSHTSGSGHVNL